MMMIHILKSSLVEGLQRTAVMALNSLNSYLNFFWPPRSGFHINLFNQFIRITRLLFCDELLSIKEIAKAEK